MTDDENPAIRLRLAGALLASVASIFGILGLSAAVTPDIAVVARIAGVIFLLVCLWLAARATRVGATVRSGRLEVRRVWRTWRVPLEQIERAYVGPGRNALQPTKTLHLVLTNGEDRVVQAISTSGLLRGSSKIVDFVDGLNAAIKAGVT
jgi:hypothetical protein